MSAYSNGHAMSEPYPAHLAGTWTAPDGERVTIRPIRPEDAGIERDFVKALSPEAKYMRFMSTLKELTPEMLARFTQVDYSRDMALIAVVPAVASDGAGERQIAVCRYVRDAGGNSCEFALVVSEAWQGRGLGTHLMRRLIEIARDRGLALMTGDILAANSGMLALVDDLGFVVSDVPGEPGIKRATLALR